MPEGSWPNEYSIWLHNKSWKRRLVRLLPVRIFHLSCVQFSYLQRVNWDKWRKGLQWTYLFLHYEVEIPPREVTFLVSWIFQRGHSLQTWLHHLVCTCLWNVKRCKIHLANAQKQVRPMRELDCFKGDSPMPWSPLGFSLLWSVQLQLHAK